MAIGKFSALELSQGGSFECAMDINLYGLVFKFQLGQYIKKPTASFNSNLLCLLGGTVHFVSSSMLNNHLCFYMIHRRYSLL